MNRLFPVILSGGSGMRLWPMSRSALPKQFRAFNSNHTMIQETALTAHALGTEAPTVLCNEDHRFLVARQLQEIGIPPQAIVLEPCARNTAPAVIAGALMISEIEPDAVILVLPSDHMIANRDAFKAALAHAVQAAQKGRLVTFGIKPNQPVTGYGYIHQGDRLTGTDNAYGVRQFIEKPDIDSARRYLTDGNYFWNSGMFVFAVKDFLAEAEKLAPDATSAARSALSASKRDLDFVRLDAAAYDKAPNISIDYAIMEKTKHAAVVPGSFGWADVGSWAAVHELSPRDKFGNTLMGDVVVNDVENSYLRTEKGLLAAIGVHDIFVIATRDAILVADRKRAQDIRAIVELLRTQNRNECVNQSRVIRPWGSYEILDAGESFQVKHIIVNPGGRLSLQMHHKRAEHWTVVHGTAQVTCGAKVFLLNEGQSTYIPLEEKHRLENLGETELHLIEVQVGTYLGEDDIVRLDDAYGRA